MITPAYGLTATERVLPSFTLDWTTGLVQSTVDVTRAGVATFIGSGGLIQSATADTQRVDYSTGTAGLLVEESRTNLVTYSDNYDDASWTHNTATITPDTTDTVSPDGTFNADAWVPDSGVTPEVSKNITVVANTNHAASIFVKAKGDAVGIRLECSASSNGFRGVFNLLTGTVISAFAIGTGAYVAGSARIEALPNDWYRISLVGIGASSVGTVTAYRFRLVDASGGVVAGDGTRGLYIYGSQLEAGAFPTSYIPTEASAVTRNADVATVSDLSWFNATEGALFARCSALTTNLGGNKYIFSLCDDSATNAIALRYGGGGTTTTFAVIDSGSATVNTQVGTFAANEITPFLGSYKLNNSATARNGGSVSTDLSCTIPTGIDTVVIGSVSSAGASIMSGHIYKLAYWSQRITNAEVQAFSKG
jgi:hypothetical protein